MTKARMTKELLREADDLCTFLNKRCWDAAYEQDQIKYNRYNALSKKAIERYARRYSNYQQHIKS